MPGLVRGMAKTAAVVGTAQATRNAVNRHSAKKDAQAYSEAVQQAQTAQPQPAPAQSAAPADGPAETIKKLAELHQQGILTDEEFEAKKKEELAKM